MSLRLQRRAELSANQIATLEGDLTAFYKNPPASYYEKADEASRHYNAQEQPFHWDLLERVSPGKTVLEVGCGTAHLCLHVEARGGIYTGLDYSENLLQNNRRRFPKAHFFSIGTPLGKTYDIVASLYTLEHIVDPPAYLESLWRYCRPDGLIAIICPELINGPDFPPSMFYGRTPRRFRQKLLAFDLIDAYRHLVDLKIHGPLWKRRARNSPPGAFWINLLPRVLHGAEYSIDADAVHMARLSDLTWFFRQRSAEILQTSADMPDVSPDVLRYSCYVLARKPKF